MERRGWLIVTRDNNISQNRAEIAAVRDNGAKMVALNQQDALTKWGQLEVFMTQWRAIEALIDAGGAVHHPGVAHRDDGNPARLEADWMRTQSRGNGDVAETGDRTYRIGYDQPCRARSLPRQP